MQNAAAPSFKEKSARHVHLGRYARSGRIGHADTVQNFCIKCSDPLFGSKKEGFLCTNCGIGTFIAFNELTRTGKTSDNCAKMVFTVQ